MPLDESISRNLVDVREKLKLAAKARPDTAPGAPKPLNSPELPPQPKLSDRIDPHRRNRDEELKRQRDELAGRLARDRSEAEAELAMLAARAEALKKISGDLDRISEKLDAVADDDMEKFRLDFFRTSGKLSVLMRQSAAPSAFAGAAPAPHRVREAFIIASAILAGCAILTACIALVFA